MAYPYKKMDEEDFEYIRFRLGENSQDAKN